MLIDQFSAETQRYFNGTVVNRLEGINEQYYSENLEDFKAFHFTVSSLKNVQESFKAFLENEMFTRENQLQSTELIKKIDVRKFS